MRPLRFALICCLAVPAFARPPEVPEFARMADLKMRLVDRLQTLRAKEEFARKPRQERMVLSFQREIVEFDGKKLTGELVARELFEKWAKLPKKEGDADAEVKRILALVPQAMKVRYANVVPIPKNNRYQASKVLVAALLHKNFHVRKAAIDSLVAIYGRSLLYKPDASSGQRKARQKKWKREIEKLRRR